MYKYMKKVYSSQKIYFYIKYNIQLDLEKFLSEFLFITSLFSVNSNFGGEKIVTRKSKENCTRQEKEMSPKTEKD